MTSKKDYASDHPSKQLLQNRSHLHFATHQPTINRVHSLKKVDSSQPTFTPSINELPFEIYPERTKTEVSKQQIVERLIDNKRDKAQSLRNQKLKKQNMEWEEQCTFQPVISLQSKRIATKDSKSTQQAHQRLYEEGLSKVRSINECTQLVTESDKQNCTFRPNINSQKPGQQNGLLPIYQRLQQIIRDKKQYLKQLQSDQDQNLQIKPALTEKTKELTENNANFKKNVLDRLFTYMKDKNNRLEELAEKKQIEIEKECPFQPSINYYSQPLAEEDFLTRQEKEAEKVKEKILYLQEMKQPLFQPSINKLSALLIETDRENQTSAEKIQRLHQQPFLSRQAEIQKIQQECYKQCTFQPQINPISKALKGAAQKHKCQCHPREQHYHFHPQINPKSKQLAENPKPKGQQMPPVEVARLEMQYRQMKECTFRPKTLGARYKSSNQKTSLKNIPGAESYKMRIQKMNARKKQDEQLRQKLFEIQKRYVERRQTKAEPFKLSEGAKKISKLKEDAEEQFKKQHPFKPETINRVR